VKGLHAPITQLGSLAAWTIIGITAAHRHWLAPNCAWKKTLGLEEKRDHEKTNFKTAKPQYQRETHYQNCMRVAYHYTHQPLQRLAATDERMRNLYIDIHSMSLFVLAYLVPSKQREPREYWVSNDRPRWALHNDICYHAVKVCASWVMMSDTRYCINIYSIINLAGTHFCYRTVGKVENWK
jgi:hypothetical protein